MLEHTPSTSETLLTPSAPPISAHAPPLAQTAHEARIETHLDSLCVPFLPAVPPAARHEVREAMRSKLEALIVAHQELGSDLGTATREAVRQLSTPTSVATGRSRRTRLSTWKHNASACVPTLLSLGLFSLFYVTYHTDFAWHLWSGLFKIVDDGMITITHGDSTVMEQGAGLTAFYRFELFIVPLLVGLITGLLFRHRAVRGVLNAVLLLAIPALLLPGAFIGLGYAGLDNLPNWTYPQWLPSPVPGLAGAAFWTILGYTGAQAGRIRGRTRRRASKRAKGRNTKTGATA
jgi:hypothetical protein